MQQQKYRIISWEEITDHCYNICTFILKDNYRPNIVLGLSRGGLIPSRIISDILIGHNIISEIKIIDVKFYNGVSETKKEPIVGDFNADIADKKVLVADDIYESGRSIGAILDKFSGNIIKTACLFRKKTDNVLNYYSEDVDEDIWIVFPWEIHEFLKEKEESNKNFIKV